MINIKLFVMKKLLFLFFVSVIAFVNVSAQRDSLSLNPMDKSVLCTIEIEVNGAFGGPYVRTIPLPYYGAEYVYSIGGPGPPQLQNFLGSTADVVLRIPDLYIMACDAESTETFLDLFVDSIEPSTGKRISVGEYYIRLLVKRGW